jgi:hypothetical protein
MYSPSYDSDKEYRAFLRQIIQMDPTKFYETEDIRCDPTDPNVSEETIDEFNYDTEATAKYLDRVYKETKDRPEYQRLYTAAAALMFSENVEIGLAVLMSYDYLAHFHNSYCLFLKNKTEWKPNDDEYYKKLIERIETN